MQEMRDKKQSHIEDKQQNGRSLIGNYLNLNELNSPIKRQELAEWIKLLDSTICGL